MPDPFRLRLLKNLTAILEMVAVPGDAAIGPGHVFRGRALYGASDPLPLISILEAPAPLDQIPAPEGSTASSGPWELVIQGWTKDDKDNPTDPAHVLMAAVKKVLAAERKKAAPRNGNNALGMAGKVTKIEVGPGVVRPPDDVSDKAYFWLNILVTMAEDLDDPYA